MYPIEDHSTGTLGYLSASARHMKLILKVKDSNNTNFASQISSFKLGANISELYKQCALKMDQLVSWKNINCLEAQNMKNLKYFAAWCGAQLACKAANEEIWDTSFIAKDMYDILIISFCGYFAYARYFIRSLIRSWIEYLRYVSSITVSFSKMRACVTHVKVT